MQPVGCGVSGCDPRSLRKFFRGQVDRAASMLTRSPLPSPLSTDLRAFRSRSRRHALSIETGNWLFIGSSPSLKRRESRKLLSADRRTNSTGGEIPRGPVHSGVKFENRRNTEPRSSRRARRFRLSEGVRRSAFNVQRSFRRPSASRPSPSSRFAGGVSDEALDVFCDKIEFKIDAIARMEAMQIRLVPGMRDDPIDEVMGSEFGDGEADSVDGD
jgi:hypothetical protein